MLGAVASVKSGSPDRIVVMNTDDALSEGKLPHTMCWPVEPLGIASRLRGAHGRTVCDPALRSLARKAEGSLGPPVGEAVESYLV